MSHERTLTLRGVGSTGVMRCRYVVSGGNEARHVLTLREGQWPCSVVEQDDEGNVAMVFHGDWELRELCAFFAKLGRRLDPDFENWARSDDELDREASAARELS
jgi:hypothetical protein